MADVELQVTGFCVQGDVVHTMVGGVWLDVLNTNEVGFGHFVVDFDVVVLGGLHQVTGNCWTIGRGVLELGAFSNVNGVVDTVNGGSNVVVCSGSYWSNSI